MKAYAINGDKCGNNGWQNPQGGPCNVCPDGYYVTGTPPNAKCRK